MNCKKCKKPMSKNGTVKKSTGMFQKYKCKCGRYADEQVTGTNKETQTTEKKCCGSTCNKSECVKAPNGECLNITIHQEPIDAAIIDAQDEIIQEQIAENAKLRKEYKKYRLLFAITL